MSISWIVERNLALVNETSSESRASQSGAATFNSLLSPGAFNLYRAGLVREVLKRQRLTFSVFLKKYKVRMKKDGKRPIQLPDFKETGFLTRDFWGKASFLLINMKNIFYHSGS